MQPDHILALAAWPPCPLHLPDQVRVGEWGIIFDVPRFIGLHLERLDSESVLLRKISARNLAALARKLSQSQPSTT